MRKTALAYIVVVVFVAAAVAGLVMAQGSTAEMKVIAAAAEALGGRDRILALRTIRIEGNGQIASQNGGGNITSSPDAPQKWQNIVDHRRTIDLANNRSRVQQRIVTNFVFARLANYGRTEQHQVVDGTIAYNVGQDGRATRASDETARTRRLEMRANPVAIVRLALSGARLGNLRSAEGVQTVDVTTPEGDVMTLAVNRETSLPEWVSWVSPNDNLGDLTYRTYFFGYDKWGGVMLPMAYTTKIDWRDTTVQTLMVDRNAVDVQADDMAAPAAVRSAAAPNPQPAPKATELGKGIWFITGGSHNSVVFEFDDHLTMFEAGASNAWAKAAMALARTLSAKPLTHVIVSHHHFDHTGGFRAAAAEGVTFITHRGNAGILQEMAARKSASHEDPIGANPRPLKLTLMDDELVLKDNSMEVRLVRVVNNNHMVHSIAAYVPRDRLLVQADMFVDSWDFQWWGAGYQATLDAYGLQVDRDVPVHGAVVPIAEVHALNKKQYETAQALCTESFKSGFPIPGCPAKP
jgi:glyoxylase-like metal-dependent hydrolase (beta-lactamase superfamily II)